MQMELVSFAKDWLINILKVSFDILSSPSNLGSVVLSCVLSVMIVGSGAIAESIGETKRRGRWIHFILGMVIPFLYPLLIFAFLPKRKIREKKEEESWSSASKEIPLFLKGKTESTSQKVNNIISQGEVSSKGPSSSPSPSTPQVKQPSVQGFDAAYFHDLAFDEMGNPRGPFLFTIDNVEIHVNRILEILPQVVVLEASMGEQQKQTLRIPYHRIQSCREI